MNRPPRGRRFPWYDALWLDDYERALAVLAAEAPDRVEAFAAACQVFATDPEFSTTVIPDLVDPGELAELRDLVAGLDRGRLELHETATFRRFVVHDLPHFTEMQVRFAPLVAEIVGEAVEPSYNFLSLYTSTGVCPVHLDTPQAKWTLDLCLSQPRPWPIHIGRVQPLLAPLSRQWEAGWEQALLADPALGFDPYVVEPGGAIVFSGSSQWHHRERLPGGPGPSTDLVFFHYVPAGTGELVEPRNWADLFGVPGLAGLGG